MKIWHNHNLYDPTFNIYYTMITNNLLCLYRFHIVVCPASMLPSSLSLSLTHRLSHRKLKSRGTSSFYIYPLLMITAKENDMSWTSYKMVKLWEMEYLFYFCQPCSELWPFVPTKSKVSCKQKQSISFIQNWIIS